MVVRLWMLAILLAVYPGVCFIRGPCRRRHRRRKGLCIHCGYNLTGNVSGVCPECGERVEAGTARKG
jgi:predicted amidophosphoribosyltransferase